MICVRETQFMCKCLFIMYNNIVIISLLIPLSAIDLCFLTFENIYLSFTSVLGNVGGSLDNKNIKIHMNIYSIILNFRRFYACFSLCFVSRLNATAGKCFFVVFRIPYQKL